MQLQRLAVQTEETPEVVLQSWVPPSARGFDGPVPPNPLGREEAVNKSSNQKCAGFSGLDSVFRSQPRAHARGSFLPALRAWFLPIRSMHKAANLYQRSLEEAGVVRPGRKPGLAVTMVWSAGGAAQEACRQARTRRFLYTSEASLGTWRRKKKAGPEAGLLTASSTGV
jgi:hypothetical protein